MKKKEFSDEISYTIDMFETIKFFFKSVISKTYFWLSTVFLVPFALYNNYIRPFLPAKFQGELKMPLEYIFLVLFVVFMIAVLQAFHKLRVQRLAELRETIPEVKEDHIFRIFYELSKEGESLKNAGTSRRQKWDEEAFKIICTYCGNSFKNNYLLKTGRRWGKFEPIEDDKYDKAVAIFKDCIDRALQEI